MKQFIKHTMYVGAFLCVASTSPAWAQITVPVNVTIQNTVTLAATQNMHFGTVAALPDGANDVTYTISTTGTMAAAAAGGTSVAEVVDDTLATEAQVTITGAADGATLNITVDNVTNPINGGETFTLGTFLQRYNGAVSDTPVTTGASFPVTYDDDFLGAGLGSRIAIGATATGDGADTFTATTVFSGDFDVLVAY